MMRSIFSAIIFLVLTRVVYAIDPRWGQGCTYIDRTEQIYCFGGEPFSENSQQILVYALNITGNSVLDLSEPQWTDIPGDPNGIRPSAASRFTFTGFPGTDTFYIQGGIVCTSCNYNSGFKYSVSSNQWNQTNKNKPVITECSVQSTYCLSWDLYRVDASSALVNDILYSFGGQTSPLTGYDQSNTTYRNTVYYINAKTGADGPSVKPQNETQLPPFTWASSMVYSYVYRSLFIFGGKQLSATEVTASMSDITVVSPQTGVYSKWKNIRSTSGSLPPARWGHSTIIDSSNRTVVMFGGCNDSGKAMNDLWLFNLDDAVWSPQETTGTPPTPRCRHSVVVLGKYMLVLFGGNDGTFNSDINVALDMTTWKWTNAPTNILPSDSSPPIDFPNSSSPQGSEGINEGGDSSSNISGGAIAGIVIGSIVGIGIIGGLFFFVSKKRNRYLSANAHVEELVGKDEITANQIHNENLSQARGSDSTKPLENTIKPDLKFGGMALPQGPIILEPVKPHGK
ncbi:hypothetical protein PHYBLDRAFT_161209 [Phycomyces blakesleeanus NRRL 1555(-)]|uniref:Uncharacterized protein n=1 Tax=Phycomyces blakesleeanus (strain ATCC 8743b / DSM 1359 / FGSC 10004 / NBRC 33097 / NRRL 1555) TaxID=763407 RepID=A0A167R0N3_PHYB8|nr:hypothetical protein PHYBLDRAFT_161209 [Phycomyces blakesleeanus NRRL 1555(-)]OAD80568.1 hypothetical protein PHYBLDRAFT_161209 [Phycomyces blakesleeanus NRRL 1555(-)]|eukprot:XP_018298608.1 hypothetical protein PHYBLDRAFT_161209 [Phycomyces blakesleeanus NRRL 1555(-)]